MIGLLLFVTSQRSHVQGFSLTTSARIPHRYVSGNSSVTHIWNTFEVLMELPRTVTQPIPPHKPHQAWQGGPTESLFQLQLALHPYMIYSPTIISYDTSTIVHSKCIIIVYSFHWCCPPLLLIAIWNMYMYCTINIVQIMSLPALCHSCFSDSLYLPATLSVWDTSIVWQLTTVSSSR